MLLRLPLRPSFSSLLPLPPSPPLQPHPRRSEPALFRTNQVAPLSLSFLPSLPSLFRPRIGLVAWARRGRESLAGRGGVRVTPVLGGVVRIARLQHRGGGAERRRAGAGR